MYGKLHTIRKSILNLILSIASIVYIYPILLVLLESVKTKADLAANPLGLPRELYFGNFVNAFKTMRYFRSLFNTTLIVAIAVAVCVVITSMAAYAIGRKGGRLYNGIYMFFLCGLIVPFQMVMIPLYKIMLGFKFINTYHGIIFVYLGTSAAFSVFLFSGFVKSVPRELEEAALIDGCGLYTTFFRIVFPLLKPAISTIAVLNTFSLWNDFLTPMLYLQKREMMTITVQLSAFVGQYYNYWSSIFAAIFLITYPMVIVYLFTQRYIISGITAGAVKG